MRNKTEVCPICHKPIRYHQFSGKIEKQCDHNMKVKMKTWFIIYGIISILLIGGIPFILPVYFIAGFDGVYRVVIEDELQK